MVNILGQGIIQAISGSAIIILSGNNNIEAKDITSQHGTALKIEGGLVDIKADKIISGSDYAIIINNATLNLKADLIKGSPADIPTGS